MKTRIALIGILFCLAFGHSHAQGDNPIRLEFPASQFSSELQYVLCDTSGLYILYPTYDIDTPVAHIVLYDVNLQKQKETSLRLPLQYIYMASTYHDGDLYVLFQEKIKKKKSPRGILLHLRPGFDGMDTLHIHNLPTEDIAHIKNYAQTIYFTCPTGKSSSNLFVLPSNRPYIHGLYLKDAPDYTIDDYAIDPAGERVFVCANIGSNSRNNVIWLCESTLEGDVTRMIDLPDTGSYRFQNARIALLDSGRLMIAGTYQLRKSSYDNTATGIYTLIYDNGEFTNIELSTYDPPAAGKTEVLYLPGRLFRDSSLVAFVTESFYPEYRYSTTYSYGVPTTEPIFMGYRFIDADVRIFDFKCHQIGNYDFPFDNMLLTNLTTHLRVTFSPDQILFYHIIGQTLTTMLTDKQLNVIDPIRSSTLFPQENHNTPMVYTTALYHWYSDYYLLSGYRFRNASNRNRNPVFFLNKLQYR